MGSLKVVHDIPGRLRLRLPAGAGTDGLEEAVTAEPGVTGVQWSPRTRSLLVRYDPEHGERGAILDTAARVTALDRPTEATDESGSAVPARRSPGSALRDGLRQTAGEIDERVQRTSRGLVGVVGLAQVALVAWAASEIVRGRVRPLAWSSALWYAHGLFRDYDVPGARG